MKYKIETPIFTGLDRWGTLGACLFLSVARLGAADLTWDIDPFTAGAQDGAGTWDSSAASWWDGTGSSIWNSAAPDNATFGTGLDLAGNFNVNLGEDITVGNLSFANLSANVGFGNTYTLMGGKTLTLMNAPIVNVADNAVIAVPLVGTAGFTKTGAGTLRISADSPNFSGTVTNSAGRLQLGNNSSTGNLGAANIVNFDRFAIRRSNAFTVSNAISGSGAMSLELNAATALTLAPASGWTYTGSTTIAPTSGGVVGGRVLLGLNDGLPVGTALTMNLSGASLVTFDLNGFDQTIGSLASGAGATVNSVVVTNRSAALSTLTVSNGLNTTFAGLLAGNLNLVKAGTNTLLLSGANTYTRDTTVSGGTLKLGVTNAIPDGASAGIVVVTQSGVLDLGGRSGEVINALAGDGVVNNTTGTGTYSLNVGSTAAATNTFSGVIQNTTGIVRLYKVGATTANVLKLTGSNTFTGDVHVNGGQLWVGNSQALGLGAKAVYVDQGTAGLCELHLDGSAGDLSLGNNLTIYGSASATKGTIVNEAGDNAINGPIICKGGGGDTVLTVSGGSLAINGQVSPNTTGRALQLKGAGSGVVNGVITDDPVNVLVSVQKRDVGTWTLAGANSYRGSTLISAGTLFVNGSIQGSNVTVSATGILGGTGAVNAAVSVLYPATLAPGANDFGNLAVNNDLNLAGAALMEIGRNGGSLTNDQVTGIGTLNYGGSLVITNLGSSPLQAGDTFKLFAAASYNNAFTNIVYPDGYVWTNNLATDGTITVLSLPVTLPNTPTNISYSFSSGNLTISWPTNYQGWILQVQTNTLSQGLAASWVDVPGSDAVTTTNIVPNPANPAVFFRLRHP